MRNNNNLPVFLKTLNCNKAYLTRHQLRVLKGQALAGDIKGARKGLYKLLERSCG